MEEELKILMIEVTYTRNLNLFMSARMAHIDELEY